MSLIDIMGSSAVALSGISLSRRTTRRSGGVVKFDAVIGDPFMNFFDAATPDNGNT
jgi:hypothetical protein